MVHGNQVVQRNQVDLSNQAGLGVQVAQGNQTVEDMGVGHLQDSYRLAEIHHLFCCLW